MTSLDPTPTRPSPRLLTFFLLSLLCVAKDWGTSQLKECWSMKVKGGTLLVYGTAAPQTQRDANGTVQAIKGGGKQFYVDHPIPGAIQAPFKLPAKRVLFGKF